jgi:hypothetical protein
MNMQISRDTIGWVGRAGNGKAFAYKVQEGSILSTEKKNESTIAKLNAIKIHLCLINHRRILQLER